MYETIEYETMQEIAAGHKLDSSEARAYILSGNATLTFVNADTGNRFTYKITKPVGAEDNCPHFVKVLSGSDNETAYAYLGCIYASGNYMHGKKSSVAENAQSARTFAWIWKNVDGLPENIEVWHEGKCLRCGRKLTVPESIESGYGPECIKRIPYKTV